MVHRPNHLTQRRTNRTILLPSHLAAGQRHKQPSPTPQTFNHKLSTPFAYSTISSPPSFDSPYKRSTNEIGTSATEKPIAFARTIISIWNVYPLLSVLSMTFCSTLFLYKRKLPVRSLTPGRNTVSANRFAPRDTNLRFRSQPYTPPSPAYRVPVTMS